MFSWVMIVISCLQAQVTQINSNKSLRVQGQLINNKAFLRSDIDSFPWVSDGSLAGTIQISSVIKYRDGNGGLLAGQLIFSGITAATGAEVYITNGTPAGTMLLADINPGTGGSNPADFTLLNGFLYFTASTPATGRELWRTDGTPGGTTLVKDIEPGPGSSFTENSVYHLFSNGTYLLFAAGTTASGNELWISDGSGAGTTMLKEINTGNSNADSANPSNFFVYNNSVLFTATDADHGDEFWTTDGTPGGTSLITDINPGSGSSTSYELIPGIKFPVFQGFHRFNNSVYFNADDGAGTGELWRTDGTATNTSLVKDVLPGFSFAFVLVADAENLTNKFIFPVSDGAGRCELWESDGSTAGTQLFKTFSPVNPGQIPLVFINPGFNPTNGTVTYPLFQGTKFFFAAPTTAEGYELWVSDGDATAAHTHIVHDINPGAGSGIDPANSFSYTYTTTALFFAANNGVLGNELWRTDGTNAGTGLVADIFTGAGDASPVLSSFTGNGKVIFTATDGDSPTATDLYVVDGTFAFLPVKLTAFTATLKNSDASLGWTTEEELNTKAFTVQRSFEGQVFEDIGTVTAAGNSSTKHSYSYTDADIVKSGKDMVYYRLRITNLDGKSDYSKVVTLKLNGDGRWNVTMLSNPVTQNNVTLLLNNAETKVKITIHDISGKIYFSKSVQNINGILSLPVALQNGMYIMEVENKNERKTIQFVKQ